MFNNVFFIILEVTLLGFYALFIYPSILKLLLLTQKVNTMKKGILLCSIAVAGVLATSCTSTTRRTNCRGKGSWYGKRNLSAVDQIKQQTQQTYYAFETAKEENHN